MTVMFADFDPGTLTGFLIAVGCGFLVVLCLLGAGVMLLQKKNYTALKCLAAAGAAFVIGIALVLLSVTLGGRLHLP